MKTWLGAIVAIASVLAASGALSQPASPGPAGRSITPEELAVYEVVIDSWLGEEQVRQLVDTRLGPSPLAAASDESCARTFDFLSEPSDQATAVSLEGAKFARKGVRLVDGSGWKPVDPGEAIAKGMSVDAALEAGFANALMSFSRIAFSRDQKHALVSYSVRCGRLCGSGSTLLLQRTGDRWAISKRCGGWVS